MQMSQGENTELLQEKQKPLPPTSQMCIKNQGPEPKSILKSGAWNGGRGLYCFLNG